MSLLRQCLHLSCNYSRSRGVTKSATNYKVFFYIPSCLLLLQNDYVFVVVVNFHAHTNLKKAKYEKQENHII